MKEGGKGRVKHRCERHIHRLPFIHILTRVRDPTYIPRNSALDQKSNHDSGAWADSPTLSPADQGKAFFFFFNITPIFLNSKVKASHYEKRKQLQRKTRN